MLDHEQSVRDLVDDAGVVLNHKMYDSFGRLASETSTAAGDDIIFGWTGREFDGETGLQYNRARYYNPNTGRFISQDPSGIVASGDYNLYCYAGNNPLNATDPTGLASRVLGQAASAVGAGLSSVLGMYSSLTAGASNSAASGIASGLAALSRPTQPVVQQVYSYNAGRYLWHDVTNEQVFNYDPGYGLRTRVNSPASAPQGQAQFASLVSFAAQGLGTGLKAVVNEGVKTIASTASLGFYEAGNVWAVNQWDQSVANYSQSAFAARIGTEALQTAATAGLSQTTKFGRVGAAVNVFDTAGNVATVGRGAADVYNQGGLTWQNSAQIVGGGLGVVGNVAGLRQAASDYPRLNPLNYSVTVDRSTLSMGGLGGFGVNYNAPSGSVIEQSRDALGRFLPKAGGEVRPGSLAEQATFDAVLRKPGWDVVRRPVAVRDPTGQLRVYDGAAISPSGRYIGLETKSGTGRLTPAQRAFDTWLNSSNANTAQGVGQSSQYVIQRAIEVRR